MASYWKPIHGTGLFNLHEWVNFYGVHVGKYIYQCHGYGMGMAISPKISEKKSWWKFDPEVLR